MAEADLLSMKGHHRRPAAVIFTILLAGVSVGWASQDVDPGVTAVPARIVAGVANAGQMSGETSLMAEPPGLAPLTLLDEHLPSWIRFWGFERMRLEGYSGLNYAPGDDESYALNRFRLGMRLQPVQWFSIYSEVQDARVFFQKPPIVPPNENTWDLHQAYIVLGGGEDEPFGMKVGRQEVNFGAGRLIGRSDWRNAGRTFDGALVSLRRHLLRMTAFSLSRVNPVAHGFSHHQAGNVTHGLYGGIDKLIPHSVVEPYVFWKLAPGAWTESGLPAKVNEKILGVRWAGLYTASVDYSAEFAAETGTIGGDTIGAEMLSLVGGFTMTEFHGRPRFFAEYFYASGDRTPGDGRHGTWDQLNPTHHDRNGIADQVGFQNLKELRFGSRVFATRNWTIGAEYNDWYLASARDGLYDLYQNVVAIDPSGRSGTHIGQEAGLETSYRLNREIDLGAGIGRIFPGAFLKKQTPGASNTYVYVMLGYKF